MKEIPTKVVMTVTADRVLWQVVSGNHPSNMKVMAKHAMKRCEDGWRGETKGTLEDELPEFEELTEAIEGNMAEYDIADALNL